MEDNNILSAEMQEVAETAVVTDTDVDVAVSVEENGSAEKQEVAEPAAETRNTADAAFADLRRKWQASESERDILSEKFAMAKDILTKFGFSGATDEDMLDAANAHFTGQDVESIRRERIERQQALSKQADLQREVEYYRRKDAERRMNDDLKAIQKLDPSVKDLKDLGKEFFDLVRNGFDGVTAFTAVRAKSEMNKKEAPPVIGRINSKTVEEKDYFTDKELSALSAKELEDPAVLAKAMKSMTKKK